MQGNFSRVRRAVEVYTVVGGHESESPNPGAGGLNADSQQLGKWQGPAGEYRMFYMRAVPYDTWMVLTRVYALGSLKKPQNRVANIHAAFSGNSGLGLLTVVCRILVQNSSVKPSRRTCRAVVLTRTM